MNWNKIAKRDRRKRLIEAGYAETTRRLVDEFELNDDDDDIGAVDQLVRLIEAECVRTTYELFEQLDLSNDAVDAVMVLAARREMHGLVLRILDSPKVARVHPHVLALACSSSKWTHDPLVVRRLLADSRPGAADRINEALVSSVRIRSNKEIFHILYADPRADPAHDNHRIIRSPPMHIEHLEVLMADPRVDPTADRLSSLRRAIEIKRPGAVDVLLADERVATSEYMYLALMCAQREWPSNEALIGRIASLVRRDLADALSSSIDTTSDAAWPRTFRRSGQGRAVELAYEEVMWLASFFGQHEMVEGMLDEKKLSNLLVLDVAISRHDRATFGIFMDRWRESGNYQLDDALAMACKHGDAEIATRILTHPAFDPHLAEFDLAIEMFKYTSKAGRLDIIEAFEEHAVCSARMRAWGMLYAACYGQTDVVLHFIADPDIPMRPPGDEHECALQWAAMGGHADIVDLFLKDARTSARDVCCAAWWAGGVCRRENIVRTLMADPRFDLLAESCRNISCFGMVDLYRAYLEYPPTNDPQTNDRLVRRTHEVFMEAFITCDDAAVDLYLTSRSPRADPSLDGNAIVRRLTKDKHTDYVHRLLDDERVMRTGNFTQRNIEMMLFRHRYAARIDPLPESACDFIAAM